MSEKWYYKTGGDDDVALSTRVRFARNIQGFPFASRMKEGQAIQVRELCKKAVNNALPTLTFKAMEDYGELEAAALAEKHLISPQFTMASPGRGIGLSSDESLSIMVGEEDHLRIQAIQPGCQLDEAFRMAEAADLALEKELEFAFDERLGYLTHCPTNLGTGMRASVMLHLPALTLTGGAGSMAAAAGKLGIAVRGIYGEGSEAAGNLYQISNQVTLGVSERQTIDKLHAIVSQVMNQERITRDNLRQEDPLGVEDRVFRARGILTSARRMPTAEFMQLISDVRLGVELGLIDDIDFATINALIIAAQPAGIATMYGACDPAGRDIARCRLLEQSLERRKGK